MVSQVTLGNFFSSNGKTVLGGVGGSGLDTQSLIKGLTDAKALPATHAKDQITLNDKQGAALNTLQTLLSTFQSAADALRNPPGVGNEADNVFKFTTATVTSDSALAGSSYVSVTSAPGAALQSYTISEVTALATAATQNTGIFTVDSANDSVVPPASGAVAFGAGTITVGGQAITIAADDSLNSIAAKFNAVSDTSGVSASVIQIDATHYSLSFAATQTGSVGNFDLSTVTGHAAVFGNAALSTVVAGVPAEFKINDIGVTRQSNTIGDLVSGVTFSLLQKTAGAKVTVAIQPDKVTTQNSIVNFVNAYNAIRTFEVQQTQTKDDGTYADTAVLANDPTFRNIVNNLNTQITAQVAGITGSNPKSLSDVGITFTTQPASGTTPAVSNVLTVNDGKLTSALATNFTGVSKLFGFNLTSTNPNVEIFSETNSLAVTQLSLTIDPNTSTFDATYDLGSGPVVQHLTAKALPGNGGYSLTGLDNSPLAGLVLIYASTSAGTATLTFTQGVADKTYNTSNSAIKQTTGTLAVALKALQDSDTRLNKDIDQINLQVSQYQQSLLDKFAALEQAIARTNSLLQSLSANSNAALVASGN